MFELGDRGEGNTLIRRAYAKPKEEEGLVVETDSRFSMRFSSQSWKDRSESKVCAGCKIVRFERTLKLQEERSFSKKQCSRYLTS